MNIEYLLLIPLIVFIIINLSVISSVKKLSNPGSLLEIVEQHENEIFEQEHEKLSNWCNLNGFTHENFFNFYGLSAGVPILCSSWWSSRDGTRALLYVANSAVNIDFVTIYGGGISITTASSKDAFTLPSPENAYIQAFVPMDNVTRYEMHKTAALKIENHHKVSKPEIRKELFSDISTSLVEQVRYIRKLYAWQLRGTYWFFVVRNIKPNRPINA